MRQVILTVPYTISSQTGQSKTLLAQISQNEARLDGWNFVNVYKINLLSQIVCANDEYDNLY